jgi:hypothetical protein
MPHGVGAEPSCAPYQAPPTDVLVVAWPASEVVVVELAGGTVVVVEVVPDGVPGFPLCASNFASC